MCYGFSVLKDSAVRFLLPLARHVDGHPIHVLGRFHNAFGEGRVSMNHFGDIRHLRSKLHRQCDFMHNIRGMGTHDMRAENLICLGVAHDFK